MDFIKYLLIAAVSGSCLSGCTVVPAMGNKSAEKAAAVPAKKSVSFYDAAGYARQLDLKKYPNAHTILLDDVESVKYNSDGTYSRSDESWTLIVTEAGRKDMRTATLHFNEFYQKAPQIDIEVIKPDGRVLKPSLQKNITIESSQMQSNIYDPANKVMTLGIPDLEIGDIVHAKWVMQTIKPRMKGVWCDIALLQSTSPILRYVYTISAPENAPLKSIAVKDEVKGALKQQITRAGDRILYRYEVKDVPQIITEPDMPPYYLHAMRVLTSTAPDWQTISRWYYNLCEPRIKAVSPELTAHVRKLTAGKKDKEAVRALFDFVSKEIRYTGVTNEDSAPGYEPHDVKDTFAQKHGVCRDKAALLVAMLREGGFDAFMVLFMAGDPKDPEIPNNYFNHAITGVKMPDGELVLMDPTDENSSDLLPAYAMDKSFLCATSNGDVLRRTPVIAPEKNMLQIRSRGSINEDYTLTLHSELTFYGINDNIYRGAFARWSEAYRQQFIASALKKTLPGAAVKSVKVLPADVRDLAQPFKLIIESTIPDVVNIQWGAGLLRMPFLSNNFGALNFMLDDKLLKSRSYPMQLFSTAGVDEKIQLELPASLEIKALPEYKNLNNDLLEVNNSTRASNKVLTADRSVKLKKVEIPVKEYSDFRKAVLNISAADNNQVIVNRLLTGKMVSAATAPAELINDHVTVKFESPTAYSIDLRQKIKVLNYAGVKEFSEISIPFVPGISQGSFISGSVTDPDGKTVPVDLKTIQIMDASNVAAPRYPAAKKIIVPLAGVKVNSVIELHWQVRTSDLAYGSSWVALWRQLPVRNSVVEFIYPASLSEKLKMVLPQAGFKVDKSFADNMHKVKISSFNVPMMPEEPRTPPAYLFAPYAGATLFDVEEYCKVVRSAITKAAEDAPQAAKLARQLTAGKKTTAEKVLAIRDYVAKNIRYAGLDLDDLGIKYISKADTTLRDGYGNSVDRAVLTYAMLKSVGVDKITIILASPVADTNEAARQFRVLPRNIFDTVVLSVVDFDNDKEYFLNDNNEYSPLEYTPHQYTISLNCNLEEQCFLISSVDLAYEDRVEGRWQIKMLPDGSAEFTQENVYFGSEFVNRKSFFANITPEKEQQYWQQQFSGVLASGELVNKSRNFDVYPGVVKRTFTVPDFWKKSGDYVSFTLPDCGFAGLVSTAGKRTLPYTFAPACSMLAEFEIVLPPEWSFCEFEGNNFSFELPGAVGEISQRSKFNAGLLRVTMRNEFTQEVIVQPQAYGILENLQKKLSNPATRTFLFKSIGK